MESFILVIVGVCLGMILARTIDLVVGWRSRRRQLWRVSDNPPEEPPVSRTHTVRTSASRSNTGHARVKNARLSKRRNTGEGGR
jgi:hypothetical protein